MPDRDCRHVEIEKSNFILHSFQDIFNAISEIALHNLKSTWIREIFILDFDFSTVAHGDWLRLLSTLAGCSRDLKTLKVPSVMVFRPSNSNLFHHTNLVSSQDETGLLLFQITSEFRSGEFLLPSLLSSGLLQKSRVYCEGMQDKPQTVYHLLQKTVSPASRDHARLLRHVIVDGDGYDWTPSSDADVADNRRQFFICGCGLTVKHLTDVVDECRWSLNRFVRGYLYRPPGPCI
jgi:hypothetical protein